MNLPPTDTPLTRAWRDWAANAGHGITNSYGTAIPPFDPMREAFFAGAASMAQIILSDESAAGWDDLRDLKLQLADRVRNP
jgi:hypothetical protein